MRVSSTIPFLDATIAKDTEVINILREWLKTQKHLPQISGEYQNYHPLNYLNSKFFYNIIKKKFKCI